MTQVDTDKLNAILEPVIEGHGFELVDLSFRREVVGWVLRVFVDRAPPPPGETEDAGPFVPRGTAASGGSSLGSPAVGGVSIDDCARLSREMSAVLDVEEPFEHPYTLEVSSPGLDRPLTRERDFRRYVGQRARVRLHDPGLEGRKNFAGVLLGFSDGSVEIEVEGARFRLPLASIAKANLEYELSAGGPKGAGQKARPGHPPAARKKNQQEQ
jgi:ribosome maturation factor RimP